MKVPTTVVFAFNPDESGIKALATFEGRVLWACIKTQHITSQHFNDNVEAVSQWLRSDRKPKTYRQFIAGIRGSGLDIFGTRMLKNDLGWEVYRTLDDEYWRGVWRYLKHRCILSIQHSSATASSPSKPKEPSGT